MIALQRDVAGGGLGKARHARELAFGDAIVEIFAAQDVFEIFHAVDVVFALLGADEQADMIPFADGLRGVKRLAGGGINGRLIESIEPAAADWIVCFLVVFKLELGAGGPNGSAFIRDVIHDAAVASDRDVVIKLQLEPIELAGGDDIAGVVWINANERAVFHLPTWTDAVHFEVVPAVEILAVEQKLPSGGLLRTGERVDLGVILGEKTNSGGQGQCDCNQKYAFHIFDVVPPPLRGQAEKEGGKGRGANCRCKVIPGHEFSNKPFRNDPQDWPDRSCSLRRFLT